MNPDLKEFLALERGALITMEDWEQLKKLLARMDMKMEELSKSRDAWRAKYEELKQANSK